MEPNDSSGPSSGGMVNGKTAIAIRRKRDDLRNLGILPRGGRLRIQAMARRGASEPGGGGSGQRQTGWGIDQAQMLQSRCHKIAKISFQRLLVSRSALLAALLTSDLDD